MSDVRTLDDIVDSLNGLQELSIQFTDKLAAEKFRLKLTGTKGRKDRAAIKAMEQAIAIGTTEVPEYTRYILQMDWDNATGIATFRCATKKRVTQSSQTYIILDAKQRFSADE